jgi:hypothetical protein
MFRASDADASDEVLRGIFCAVNAGDVNAGKSFILTTPDAITLNSTGLTFAEYGTVSTPSYVALTNLDEYATPPAVGDLCYIEEGELAVLASGAQNRVLGVKSATGTIVTFGPVVVSADASAAFSAGDEVIAGDGGVVITRDQVSTLLSVGDWIVRVGFALETTTAGEDVQILFNRGDAIEIP